MGFFSSVKLPTVYTTVNPLSVTISLVTSSIYFTIRQVSANFICICSSRLLPLVRVTPKSPLYLSNTMISYDFLCIMSIFPSVFLLTFLYYTDSYETLRVRSSFLILKIRFQISPSNFQMFFLRTCIINFLLSVLFNNDKT